MIECFSKIVRRHRTRIKYWGDRSYGTHCGWVEWRVKGSKKYRRPFAGRRWSELKMALQEGCGRMIGGK